ncbi:MAG: hypothetical protein Q9203_004782 [Teloschistes exilis]
MRTLDCISSSLQAFLGFWHLPGLKTAHKAAMGNPGGGGTPGTSSPTSAMLPQSSLEDNVPSITPGSSPPSLSSEEPGLTSDSVAVIGFSCRVAGNNNSPSQLWDFLLEKGDAAGEIPPVRWDPYRVRQARNQEILSETTSKGYFLSNLEHFDASFFGISPREAEQMDPQQRVTVETVWEALEHAGIPPQELSGSDTAVFMGVNSDDYAKLLLEDLPNVEAWMGVGTAYCGVPNRVSHLLDLMGPSSAIDAACASSLVAVHHGRQALLAGETALAIAGGVNALIGPGLTRVLDKAGAIASDGRCRSFDESAAGYGRGEGAGIVIMKRLQDAERDGDHILAILKGSAVGADGRTNGIMAPNQYAQERVAKQALKAAGVSADSISYIEAHATSTPLGDLTECSAMANVYGSQVRQPGSQPCYIGSIKPNIGHLEAGAGVMGLIKAIMVLQKGVVPPQANLVTPTTKIDWAKSMLAPVTEATNLPTGRPLRAAIASYGYGGTVSHAIIEAPSSEPPSIRKVLSRVTNGQDPTLLLLSAPSSSRLKTAASDLAHFLGASEEVRSHQIDLHSIAYTLAVKRGHHRFRTAIVADSLTEAIYLLNEVTQSRSNPHTFTGRASSTSENPKVVWVFSGHGAQWKHMGSTLLDEEPAFAEVVELLEPIVDRELGFSATAALRSGDFESATKVQVLIYIMQVGLAAVLKASGLQPQAVIGHSHGEIAASVVAGALTIIEGALISCTRARLFRSVAGLGAMILVNIPYHDAVEEIGERSNVSVAIDSSPGFCVVSGTLEAIEMLSAEWKEKNVQVRTVQTDTAFHSPMLLPLVAPLQEILKGTLHPRPPHIPLYSTSASDPRTTTSRDTDYWIANMVKPVLLNPAIRAVAEDGYRVFLEVSSHPIVSHSISEILTDADISDAVVFPTLLRNKDTQRSLLLALGKLHCVGDAADFKRVLPGEWLQNLPGTRWEHQPYWRKVTDASASRRVTHDVHAHNLLGARTPVSGTNTVVWQTHLDTSTKPFPGQHPLHGAEIVPAAVLLNTFLSATPVHVLRNVSFRVPVVVGPPQQIQVVCEETRIRIASKLTVAEDGTGQDTGSWLVNTTAHLLSDEDGIPLVADVDISTIKHRLTTRLSDSFSVQYLADVGVSEMGFPWKVLEHYGNENEMLAKLHADPESTSSKSWNESSWASILDAATSISSTIFFNKPLLRMPTALEQISIRMDEKPPAVSYIYVNKAAAAYTADVTILGESGHVLCKFQNLKFAGIEGNPDSRRSEKGLVHKLAWPPAQLSEEPLKFHQVSILANEPSPLLTSYRDRLNTLGILNNTVAEVDAISDSSDDTIIVFILDGAQTEAEVYRVSETSCDRLLRLVKHLVEKGSHSRIFCITQGAINGTSIHSLSQAALIGLARIIKSEEPEIFGGLIDVEDKQFPMQAIKYIQGRDVVRIEDGVARNARLRPFTKAILAKQMPFRLHPYGTYVITGGLGALGLEVASYLAEKGARRLVLVSRRGFIPRRQWESQKENPVVQRILALEATGVSVHPVSVDMTGGEASEMLLKALNKLDVPPVLGVVHAAGTLANQLVRETTPEAFSSVTAPKIQGALALHQAFPPKTLDFMVFFSSCGQLLGFPGQAAYGTGNAFLDSLASHRRSLGDKAVSIMWTSWRGLGMAASTKYIDAELGARGITDVTRDDAFLAWEQIFSYDTDQAVVLRTLPVEEHEAPAHPILEDIVERRRTSVGEAAAGEAEPTDGPTLQDHIFKKVTQCVASTLSLVVGDVDPHVALSELGMDSVMSVELRLQLQHAMKVIVGPTLIWNCPTISHLVAHFVKQKAK